MRCSEFTSRLSVSFWDMMKYDAFVMNSSSKMVKCCEPLLLDDVALFGDSLLAV